MTKNAKNPWNFNPFSNPEESMQQWHESAKTFTSFVQRQMAEAMKKGKKGVSSGMKQPPFNKEWNKNWETVMEETQKMMAQNMKAFGMPSMGNAIFDPEVITETFNEAFMKMAEHPDKFENLRARFLKDFQGLIQSTMENLQGKISKAFIKPSSADKRFQDPAWKENPYFSLLQQSYLLNVKFLKEAVSSIEGLDPMTRNKLMFYISHLCDALAPTNFPLTNPTVLHETVESSGKNLALGFQKLLEDAASGQWHTRMTDMSAFQLGETIAATPGKVVFQNDLFQLIQYEPLSKRVAKRPLLIIPPWINKYYIFDLRPENSFVRWALESGLSVFIISWVNPDEKLADKTLTDYTLQGVKTAIDTVCKITGEKKVNALGYCSGGTLLSLLMAYLEKKKESPVASATLLTTPYDFSKADDLAIYRCEHQQRKLEEYVQKKGYLEGKYMVQAFSLLRANDLIWSSYINNYLLGREPFPFDMLYWNCDAIRMPAKMHMAYLRDIVIDNSLMEPGSLVIDDVPIDLKKIKTPLFIMAAHDDHIAPWRSVYPITQIAQSSSKKFILSASGHVASVINPPSRQKYHYWTSDDLPKEADGWLKNAQKHQGSWWNEWRQWLDAYGEGTVLAQPVSEDLVIENAPGRYAFTVAD